MPVASEHSQQTTDIQQQLTNIMCAITAFGEQQALSYEAVNQRLDLFAKQQKNMNEKLNLIAKAIGVDFDTEKI